MHQGKLRESWKNCERQPRKVVSLKLLLVVASLCLLTTTSQARQSLSDPGVLQRENVKDGVFSVEYSDGLTVSIDQRGNFKSVRSADDYSMEATPGEETEEPGSGDSDDFNKEIIDLTRMHSKDPNGSLIQAALLVYSWYYLKANHPQKVEPLAKELLHIQTVLLATGLPMASAQRILGEAELKLNKWDTAIVSLSAAARYHETQADSESFCEVSNELGLALLNSGRFDDAIKEFERCLRRAERNNVSGIKSQVKSNLKLAKANMKKR